MNPIDSALGLRPIEQSKEQDTTPADTTPAVVEQKITDLSVSSDLLSDDENLKDIELARKNIQNIIEKGDESLKEMIALAKQSESPRAFEVASTLMKTLLDANREFVEMSTRKKYAKEEILNPKKEEETNTTNVTNNNLILSTADLLKMIKGET
jgi:hypothetical protein